MCAARRWGAANVSCDQEAASSNALNGHVALHSMGAEAAAGVAERVRAVSTSTQGSIRPFRGRPALAAHQCPPFAWPGAKKARPLARSAFAEPKLL
jgi:hypothetical protein